MNGRGKKIFDFRRSSTLHKVIIIIIIIIIIIP